MNGHPPASAWTKRRDAAEADAALMNGHSAAITAAFAACQAAEADAALMNGHFQLDSTGL